MLDHLLTVNDIDLSLEENGGLDEKDRIFIKELINGYPLGFKPSEKDNPRYEWGNPPPPYKGRGSDKIFLYEIVSNKRTGLDVDRLDYLQRDVQAALGQYSKTFERLSECVAVCTDQRGNLVLAYPEDEVQSVMETYTTRMSMYNKVYMHRKTLIMVCVSYEEEDTCVSYEEEDTCVSYEEEDTCTARLSSWYVAPAIDEQE
jgi:hypothetical protein